MFAGQAIFVTDGFNVAHIDALVSCIAGAPTITLSAAAPGLGFLLVDFLLQCPPIPFGGGSLLYVAPTIVLGPIPHGGSFSLPAPMPPTVPVGAPVFIQWASQITATGTIETSTGMVFSTARL